MLKGISSLWLDRGGFSRYTHNDFWARLLGTRICRSLGRMRTRDGSQKQAIGAMEAVRLARTIRLQIRAAGLSLRHMRAEYDLRFVVSSPLTTRPAGDRVVLV